jgi:hypothetical protein
MFAAPPLPKGFSIFSKSGSGGPLNIERHSEVVHKRHSRVKHSTMRKENSRVIWRRRGKNEEYHLISKGEKGGQDLSWGHFGPWGDLFGYYGIR